MREIVHVGHCNMTNTMFIFVLFKSICEHVHHPYLCILTFVSAHACLPVFVCFRMGGGFIINQDPSLSMKAHTTWLNDRKLAIIKACQSSSLHPLCSSITWIHVLPSAAPLPDCHHSPSIIMGISVLPDLTQHLFHDHNF